MLVETPRGRLPAVVSTPPAGTPVRADAVLAGGFLIGKGMWIPAMRRLSRHGYRVCAYDHLGAACAGPEDPGAYSLDSLASDLLAVAEKFADARPVHLVGSCFGGFVARTAALRSPESALSLTLLASGPSMDESNDPAFASWWERIALSSGHDGLWEVMTGWMPPRPGRPTRSAEQFRQNFLATQIGHLAGFPRSVADARFPEDSLRDLDIPKFVVFGENDNVWTPAVQEAMAQRIGAGTVMISRADHAPLLDRPSTTASVLKDFLESADATREDARV